MGIIKTSSVTFVALMVVLGFVNAQFGFYDLQAVDDTKLIGTTE